MSERSLWTDEQQAAEVARLAGIAAEVGCRPEDLDQRTIDARARQSGLAWHEVATVDALRTPEAQAAKAAHDEVCAAHLATFGKPIAREKAIAVAVRVRAEPGKASILVAQAMADVVAEALVKAEASPKPQVKP